MMNIDPALLVTAFYKTSYKIYKKFDLTYQVI